MEENWDDVIQVPRFDLLGEQRAEARNRRGCILLGAVAVVLLALAEVVAFMELPFLRELSQAVRSGAAWLLTGAGVLVAACVLLGMRKERRRG